MKMIGLIALAVSLTCDCARAEDPFWDEWARYFQRIDTISVASGDARQVNAVTHIINPWPRYVRNRRIPADGQRMVRAIQNYKNGGKSASSGAAGAPGGSTTSGAGGGGAAGGGGDAGGGYLPGQ
jgi:uncharacterized membrane protein YgcG